LWNSIYKSFNQQRVVTKAKAESTRSESESESEDELKQSKAEHLMHLGTKSMPCDPPALLRQFHLSARLTELR
jgi:hypothetical protein